MTARPLSRYEAEGLLAKTSHGEGRWYWMTDTDRIELGDRAFRAQGWEARPRNPFSLGIIRAKGRV